MSEEKQAEGKITEINIVGEGKKADGTPWTRFKYKIGNRFYSGFLDLSKREIKLNSYVIVTYTEKENPKNKDQPFKNIVNIVEGVSKEEVKESDEQYNVKSIYAEEPKADDNYQENQIKGMIFKKTVDWIIATRRLALEGKLRDKENKLISAQDYTLEKNYDTVFDFLMKKVK